MKEMAGSRGLLNWLSPWNVLMGRLIVGAAEPFLTLHMHSLSPWVDLLNRKFSFLQTFFFNLVGFRLCLDYPTFCFFLALFWQFIGIIKNKWEKRLLPMLYLTISPSLSFALVKTFSTSCTVSSWWFLLCSSRLGLLASKQPFFWGLHPWKVQLDVFQSISGLTGLASQRELIVGNSLSLLLSSLLSSFLFLFTCFCCFKGFCLD